MSMSNDISRDDLLLSCGVYRNDDDLLVMINSEVLNEEDSDYTTQDFIGLQTKPTEQKKPTSTHKKKIETAYEYLMKDIGNNNNNNNNINHNNTNTNTNFQQGEVAGDISTKQPPNPTLRIDRDNLFNASEIENLSTDTTLFTYSLATNSELLSVEGLTQLPHRKNTSTTSLSDPLVIIDSSVPPSDLIARCIGKLIYSNNSPKDIQIRPISAGIGGISPDRIYSPILSSVRPLSAKPKSSQTATAAATYFPHTKKRQVIQKSLPTDYWGIVD